MSSKKIEMVDFESQNEKKSLSEFKLTVEEYDKLLEDQFWLNCLNQAGVDNWQGIDEAYNIKDEASK